MHLIAGNLCSLCAMAADSFSSSRKTAKGVLVAQIVSQFFYGLGTLILGGYSASVQNVVSIIRNLVAIRGIEKRWLEWVLVLLGIVFGIYFNTLGLIGLLPVLANLEYTVAIFRFKDDERSLKLAFLVNVILFGIFNVFILNIVGLLSNIVVLVMLIIFLVKDHRRPTQTTGE